MAIAPPCSMLASFAFDTASGSTTERLCPVIRAACAQAIPWFPDDAVTRGVSLDSEDSLDTAPRNLNDPVVWKFSHLNTRPLPTDDLALERIHGVSTIALAMRLWVATAFAARVRTDSEGFKGTVLRAGFQ
jgi:hypothetical protein